MEALINLFVSPVRLVLDSNLPIWEKLVLLFGIFTIFLIVCFLSSFVVKAGSNLADKFIKR